MDTTREELADLIFNSEDSELNDMMIEAKKYNYEIPHLIWKMMADINGHFSDYLKQLADQPEERRKYLIQKIKSEMNYYAHWYKKEQEKE